MFKFLLNCVIFYLIFCGLEGLALVTITCCDGFCLFVEMDCDVEKFLDVIQKENAISFVNSLRSNLLGEIPLSEIADKLVDNSGFLVSSAEELTDGVRRGWKEFLPSIFPDTVKSVIANFMIAILILIKKFLSKAFPGWGAKIALFFSMGWIGIAGFSLSSTLLFIIDQAVEKRLFNLTCFLVALICFLLHLLLLSGLKADNARVIRFFISLGTAVIINVANSIVCWFVCFNLDGMYDPTGIWRLIVVFVVFCLLIYVEGLLTKSRP